MGRRVARRFWSDWGRNMSALCMGGTVSRSSSSIFSKTSSRPPRAAECNSGGTTPVGLTWGSSRSTVNTLALANPWLKNASPRAPLGICGLRLRSSTKKESDALGEARVTRAAECGHPSDDVSRRSGGETFYAPGHISSLITRGERYTDR